MREVDISIVAYRPELDMIGRLVASLAEPVGEPLARNLFVLDNSGDAVELEKLRALPALQPGGAFARVEIETSPTNVGFGRGHNFNAARGTAQWLLVINQDCVLEPGVLERLVDSAASDGADVAAWELRQIPYEHPKAYDPVTLETPWVSGAAVLLRRRAFEAMQGFEPAIFMYGEDVDLSWRLRAAGWRLVYRPKLGVVHRTYREAEEVKPLQVLGGVRTNLCLRARFGGFIPTLKGLAMLAGEIVAPPSFRGRRRGLLRAGLGFLARWPHFALTRVHPNERFQPVFAGWSYELRRAGAFVALPSRREVSPKQALVSILVRTMDRPAWLRETLASVANQTYENLEVVVIEDGPERSRAVIEEFRDRLDIRYRATGARVGRARAGNLALAEAKGEWLNFLDDDDVFFADHVETLTDALADSTAAGAYALAWETQTEVIDRGEARYREVMHVTRHEQPFDRLVLWHHNYLPIQAVMFHRRLWERHGGFDETMDQLEDWNLWTRYTLEEDFVLVHKTTSKYRVPAAAAAAAERQSLLDKAYLQALERQRDLAVTLSPRQIAEMAEAYARSQSVVMVTRSDLRRFVGSHRVLARLAAYRQPARRVLRRLAGLRR